MMHTLFRVRIFFDRAPLRGRRDWAGVDRCSYTRWSDEDDGGNDDDEAHSKIFGGHFPVPSPGIFNYLDCKNPAGRLKARLNSCNFLIVRELRESAQWESSVAKIEVNSMEMAVFMRVSAEYGRKDTTFGDYQRVTCLAILIWTAF